MKENFEQIKEFLLWARNNSLWVPRLKVGDIELELEELVLPGSVEQTDDKDPDSSKWDPPADPPAPTIYEHFDQKYGLSEGDGPANGVAA